MTTPFYIYVYLDPRKPGIFKYSNYVFKYEPFYIGKGGKADTDNYKRYYEHIKKAILGHDLKNPHKFLKLKKIMKMFQEPLIEFVGFYEKESEAFKIERECIQLIGRSDLNKGPLTNLTDGGDGSFKLSKNSRKKISESLRGNIPWNIRKKCSEELKKKISKKVKLSKKIMKKKEDYRPEYISIKKEKIYTFSEIQRKNISKGCQGRIPWHKGLRGVQVAWNKGLRLSPGKKHTEKDLIKMRLNKNRKSVEQYDFEGKLINTFQSQREAARITGFKREGIRDCCSGRQKSAYGFEWKIIERN